MTEKLRRTEWTVERVPLSTCHRLEALYHYAHGGSKAGFGYGLFHRDDLLTCRGVAHWIPPTRAAAKATHAADPNAVLALHRLAIAPNVPPNACTFLIARSIRLLPSQYTVLVSYADERMGHRGTIYHAAGWTYMGRVDGGMSWVDPRNGRQMHIRRGQRTLTFAEMEALGYERQGYHGKHKFVLHRRVRGHSARTLFDQIAQEQSV